MKKLALSTIVFLSPVLAHAFPSAVAVTVKDGTLQAGTTTGFNVSSGSVTTLYTSSAGVYSSMYIGPPGLSGKPDSPLFIYNNATQFSSRPGLGIDVTNTSSSRIPVCVFTNRSGPGTSRGTCLAFYQQMLDGTDVQNGLLAYSQNATTYTAKSEFYLHAGSATSNNSLPVVNMLGTAKTGYAFTMFGPTGAEYASLYEYGAYTPSAMIHVANDFEDDSDGIRWERKRTPNATRYNARINSSGDFIFDSVGDVLSGSPYLTLRHSDGFLTVQGPFRNLGVQTNGYGVEVASGLLAADFGLTVSTISNGGEKFGVGNSSISLRMPTIELNSSSSGYGIQNSSGSLRADFGLSVATDALLERFSVRTTSISANLPVFTLASNSKGYGFQNSSGAIRSDFGLSVSTDNGTERFAVGTSSIACNIPTFITGVNDGSAEIAGKTGELLQETDGNDRGVISGQFVSHSTLTVTAGDWLCSGYIEINGNGVAWSAASAALSLFPNNTTTDHSTGYNVVNYNPASPGNADIIGLSIPQFRVNVNASTSVYIKDKVTTAGLVKFRDSAVNCTRIR